MEFLVFLVLRFILRYHYLSI